ncbi:hypothetical protein [Peribacillus deserti]|uniref:DUF3899 domain-containing protein n=1 Tax=Peribacillus deserti TaxID=673318 RepID=A0A2N5M0M9_9BACI|nr:hypothetical protein [Peribacillus deserti]PLT27875.1 hypothetical protein CUU66_21575 [Peribacillus deserti]
MKKVIVCISTLICIGLVNYLGTFAGISFIDSSFFCGHLSTVIIHFFTSSGGFSSNQVRLQVQAQTGLKVEEERSSFTPSVAYYTAIAYTVVSLAAIIFYYKDYFI